MSIGRKIHAGLRRGGLQRLEAGVLALMIALPTGFLAFGDSYAFADSDDENEAREHEARERSGQMPAPVRPADPVATAAWKEECGSCHVAYPTRLLPAASWQHIMGNLGDHYGSDASIDDPAVVAKITGLLVRGSGDAARFAVGKSMPLRITETRWFIREHDEVGAAVWKRPSIKSAANCGACHQNAADGNFSERGIRIPKQ